MKELKKELAEALVAVKNLSGNSDGKIIEHRTAEQDEHDTLRSAIDDTVHKLRALNSDGQAVREELSGIRAANGNLDRYIWDTEEVLLLNAFREVLNRVEEVRNIYHRSLDKSGGSRLKWINPYLYRQRTIYIRIVI